jgi:hypothetical protein
MGFGRMPLTLSRLHLCDSVVDKTLNRNVLQHVGAENAVTVLTAFFVRQVLKQGGPDGL